MATLERLQSLLPEKAPWLISEQDMKYHNFTHVLGSGNSANVYEGSWLDCPVAVKKMNPAVFMDAVSLTSQGERSTKRRLSKEKVEDLCDLMTSLSTLHHPHVVEFYGLACVSKSEVPLLVSEQLYQSLSHRQQDQSCEALSVRDCVDVVLQVSSALQYLHDRSRVHGNLSTGNVLLTASGICKVSDAASAKFFFNGEQEQLESVYLPLHIPRGEQFSASVDVYSLGVVLLEILTTRSPIKSCKTALDMEASSRSGATHSGLSAYEHSEATPSSLARLSTAKVRFGEYIKQLIPREKELSELVTVLLQPTRPTLMKARKRLVSLTALEAYTKSQSTLAVSVQHFVKEVRHLRETISEVQDQNTQDGCKLQEAVEDQAEDIAENAKKTGSILTIARDIRDDIKIQHGVLMGIRAEFPGLDSRIHMICNHIINLLESRQHERHLAFVRSSHPSFAASYGDNRSLGGESFNASFDESAFQFQGVPYVQSPVGYLHHVPFQAQNYYATPQGPDAEAGESDVLSHSGGSTGIPRTSDDEYQSPEYGMRMPGQSATCPPGSESLFASEMSETGMDLQDDWPGEVDKIGVEAPDEGTARQRLPQQVRADYDEAMESETAAELDTSDTVGQSALQSGQQEQADERLAMTTQEMDDRYTVGSSSSAARGLAHEAVNSAPQAPGSNVLAQTEAILIERQAGDHGFTATTEEGDAQDGSHSLPVTDNTSIEAASAAENQEFESTEENLCPTCGHTSVSVANDDQPDVTPVVQRRQLNLGSASSLSPEDMKTQLSTLQESINEQQRLQVCDMKEILAKHLETLQNLHVQHQQQLEHFQSLCLAHPAATSARELSPVRSESGQPDHADAQVSPLHQLLPLSAHADVADHLETHRITDARSSVDDDTDSDSSDSEETDDGPLSTSWRAVATNVQHLFQGLVGMFEVT